MEERLTILKKLRDKSVMNMNKNLEIYGAFRHKKNFRWFFLSTDDPVFIRVKGLGRWTVFQILGFETVNGRF